MKRKVLSILAVVVFTLSLCAFSSPKEQFPLDVEVTYYTDYWKTDELEGTMFANQQEIEALVETEMIEVSELLGMDDFWYYANPEAENIVINMEIMNMNKSLASSLSRYGEKGVTGSLSLSTRASDIYQDGAMAHEITHLVLGDTFSYSLEEGMCEYVRERVGYSSILDYMAERGVELTEQEYLKLEYLVTSEGILASGKGTQEQLDTIWENVGKKGGYPYSPTIWKGGMWYSLSHSFVSWLVEEYSVEEIITLMQQGGDESAYEQYLGKSLDELRAEWVTYFQELELSITPEELHARLSDDETQSKKADELGIDIQFNYYADYWKVYDFSNTPYPTKEEFEALVKAEILEVCDLLEYEEFWAYANPNAKTLYIDVQFQGLNKSQMAWLREFGEDSVSSCLFLAYDTTGLGTDSALSHELTHMLSGDTFSISLQEGVCNYVRERVGYSSETALCRENGLNIGEQELLKLNYESRCKRLLNEGSTQEEIDAIWGHIGKAGWYPYVINTPESSMWYVLSHSFVTFLVEEYGMENVILTMQQGEDESAYEQYLGKSLHELKAEWIAYFEALELSVTLEELQAAMTASI